MNPSHQPRDTQRATITGARLLALIILAYLLIIGGVVLWVTS